jgi:hypothetical protein
VNAVVLLIAVASVVATGALFAAVLHLQSIISFLLAVFVLASVEVVVVSLFLSLAGWLTRSQLLMGISVVLAVAIFSWVRAGSPRPRLGRGADAAREVLRDRIVATLAVLVAIVQLYLLASALTVPQSSSDTLLYHLPRAALWKQEQRVGYVRDAPDERINAAPPYAEIGVAASMVLSRGDRYASLVQLASLVVVCLGVVGIALRLGFITREAAFGALVYSTYTVVALQTPTALNDLAVAAALVACTYFGLGETRAEHALAGAALGLALGTKLTTVLALPVLAIFVWAAHRHTRWLLVLYGALGLAFGSIWYWVNLRATGRLDGGFSKAFPQIADHSPDAILERSGLLLRDLLELSGAEGEGWLTSPWPGVVFGLAVMFVAVVCWASGRGRVAGMLALVSLCGAVAYPTVVTWLDIATRVASQLAVTARLSEDATAQRVPDQLYESPLSSAYGIGFVVLLVCGAGIVARELSGRRRFVALVALASVPALVAVLVLSLEYDPLRMRFLAFPVALASATFGVVLRVRVIAWAAVGLSVASLSVALGYFVPRPAGLALLPGNRSSDLNARWFVQAESGNGDLDTFRFLAEHVPTDTTIALAVRRNTYTYQAWDEGLERRVVFVPQSGVIPDEAWWLVVGPGVELGEGGRSRGWLSELSSGGWRVLRRVG